MTLWSEGAVTLPEFWTAATDSLPSVLETPFACSCQDSGTLAIPGIIFLEDLPKAGCSSPTSSLGQEVGPMACSSLLHPLGPWRSTSLCIPLYPSFSVLTEDFDMCLASLPSIVSFLWKELVNNLTGLVVGLSPCSPLGASCPPHSSLSSCP